MIRLRMPDGVRGHVGQHKVDGTIKRLLKALRRIVIHEIHLKNRNTFDRVGWEEVYADDLRLRDQPANDLAPAARRDTEVDDRPDTLQQPETLVELEQLVSRAAAVILRLGPLDVGIVELALEPARRGNFATSCGLDALHA